MTIETFLRRFIVIGIDQHDGVCSVPARLFGQRDGLRGGIGAGPGDDQRPAGHQFDGLANQLPVLGMRERRRLAGGPAGDDAGDSRGDLPLDQFAIGTVVDAAPFVLKRGDDCRINSVEINGHKHFRLC